MYVYQMHNLVVLSTMHIIRYKHSYAIITFIWLYFSDVNFLQHFIIQL